MTQQTKDLCQSMPQLAKWFENYDEKGHKWIIVSWYEIPPWRVTLHDMRLLSVVHIEGVEVPNLFTSRTSALRRSEEACVHITHRTQTEHWGVWKWTDEKGLYYQSALSAVAFNSLAS